MALGSLSLAIVWLITSLLVGVDGQAAATSTSATNAAAATTVFGASSTQSVSATSPTLAMPTLLTASSETSLSHPALSSSASLALIIVLSAGGVIILACFVFFAAFQRSAGKQHDSTGFHVLNGTGQQDVDRDNIKLLAMSQVRPIQTSSRASKPTRRSWVAPLMMLGGLVMGLVLALGHHYFYYYLSGQATQQVSIPQSWVFRLGNLFAILVKLCLSISMGTAFVQVQWLTLHEQPLNVKEIDTVSGALNSLLNLLSRVWLRFPRLAILAALCWLLTIVPVITPGTLNVVLFPNNVITQIQVPELNPSSAINWYDGGVELVALPIRPLKSVSQAILTPAFGGKITSMTPEYANSTYQLQFHGPSIKCMLPNESVVLNWTESYGWTQGENGGSNYFQYNGYISPNFPDDFLSDTSSALPTVDTSDTDASRLFFITSQGNDPPTTPPDVTINGTEYWYKNYTECQFQNASYDLTYEFQNGQQTVYANVTNLHGIAASTIRSLNDSGSYLALMAGLGQLLIGSIGVSIQTGDTVEFTQVDYLHFEYNDLNSFRDGVESLMHNMTISLLATDMSLGLTQNTTVKANTINYLTTYSYDPLDLVLTYSLGLLFTFGCFALGFYAFLGNDGSYHNNFSTYIRATRTSEIPIDENDTGAAPRPKQLGRHMVSVTGCALKEQSYQEPAARKLISRRPLASTGGTNY